MEPPETFDAATAQTFKNRPGGSPHRVFRDEHGQLSMVCRSDRAERGVCVNQAGLAWLEDQEATAKYVRVINPNSRFDRTFRLEDMPDVELRGTARPYYMLDPEDFEADEGYPPPF